MILQKLTIQSISNWLMEPTEDQTNLNEATALYFFGTFFCQRCKNMITPYEAHGSILQFKCNSCGVKEISFQGKKGQELLMVEKEFKKASENNFAELNNIFDPSMPTAEITCPECGYNRAIYSLISDENQTKMIVRMMCKNAVGTTIKCGHVWDLNDESVLAKNKVKIKIQEQQDEDFSIHQFK